MSEGHGADLHYFPLFRFTSGYWELDRRQRQSMILGWLEEIRGAATALHVYQTFGTAAYGDLILWIYRRCDSETDPGCFFRALAVISREVRRYVEMELVLWGFSRKSPYVKGRSRSEMDAQKQPRKPYLIVYPFVKTAEWYAKPAAERKRIMTEHIRVGKRYSDVSQLLLYSFGLQDQEFVVVYETESLTRFSRLVSDLRGTEARPYTKRDSPLRVGVHQVGDDELLSWL